MNIEKRDFNELEKNLKKEIREEGKLDTRVKKESEKLSKANEHIRDLEKRLSYLEKKSKQRDRDNIKMELDNEIVSRMSLENDIGKIKMGLESVKSKVNDKKLHSMYDKEMNNIRREMESEMDSHVQDFRNKINEWRSLLMKESGEFTKFIRENDVAMLHAEIKKNREMLKKMNKSIEVTATKFFAENLEDFVSTLDNKLPEMVSKDQYVKDMKHVLESLNDQDDKDLEEIKERVKHLEYSIGKLIEIMRTHIDNSPSVIE